MPVKGIRVCKLSELLPGEITPIELEGEPIALVKLGDKVHAFRNRCTHLEVELTDAFISNQRIYCPMHDSEFDLETGAALSGPAALDLPIYETCIDDGDVYVNVPTMNKLA